MSFILDALKKSEAERQRQAGPTLLELRITRPPRRYPHWALVVGALLALNVAVLLIVLLHRPASPSGAPAVALTPAITGAPVVTAARATAAVAPPSNNAPNAATAVAPVTAAPASSTPPPTVAPLIANGAAALPAHNPADDLPAVPPGSSAAVSYATLPSLGELSGNIPALQLNLLDYSDLPARRYALINMHHVREGDTLPEGARVLAITRDGVALDYHGQQFMLRPGGTAPSGP